MLVMRSRLSPVALIVCLVAGVVACGGSTGRVGGGGVVAAANVLTEVIQLSATQVVGGQPIPAALVVSNPGGTINLNPHGCRPEFTIVLTNSDFPPHVAWPAMCVAGPFLVPHGTTRLPISVLTTYPGCLQPGGSGSGLPKCSTSGPPPLPPGAYTAVLEWEGAVPLPPAQPVAVTILAS